MEEKKKEERKLPPIRQDKEVKEGELQIICGNKKAALPPPFRREA